MNTVVVGEQPWLTEVVQRRRALGQDLYDEVWEGVPHVAPNAGTEHARVAVEVMMALRDRVRARELISSGPFNLGTGQTNFRVPDGGWFRAAPRGVYAAIALAVLEVLSPDDETYEKFDFYLRHGVAEVLVAHPTERWVRCHVSEGALWREAAVSRVFEVSMAELESQMHWPWRSPHRGAKIKEPPIDLRP